MELGATRPSPDSSRSRPLSVGVPRDCTSRATSITETYCKIVRPDRLRTIAGIRGGPTDVIAIPHLGPLVAIFELLPRRDGRMLLELRVRQSENVMSSG